VLNFKHKVLNFDIKKQLK
jgi:hypothetical protein